jgi:hypothetical protein
VRVVADELLKVCEKVHPVSVGGVLLMWMFFRVIAPLFGN